MIERERNDKILNTHDDFKKLYIKAAADALKFSGPIERDSRADRALWFTKLGDFEEILNCLEIMHRHTNDYDATFQAAKFISKFEGDAEARLDFAMKLASMARIEPNMFKELAGFLENLRVYESVKNGAIMQYSDKFGMFLLLDTKGFQYITVGDKLSLVEWIEKMKVKKMDERFRAILENIQKGLKSDIFERAWRTLRATEDDKLRRM